MITRHSLRVILFGFAATAALAACSSDSKSSSSTTSTTQSSAAASTTAAAATGKLDCAKAENAVKAALGSLPKVEEIGLLGVTSCQWDGPGGEAAVNTATKTVYTPVLEAFEGQPTQPVAGLGDRAFIVKGFSSSTSGGTGGKTLWVVKGNQVYSFALDPESGVPSEAQLRALAQPYL